MGVARGREGPPPPLLAAGRPRLAGAALRALDAAGFRGAHAAREPLRGRGLRRLDGAAAAHGGAVAAGGRAWGISPGHGLGMAARPLCAVSGFFTRSLPRLLAALVPHALGIARRRAGHRLVAQAPRLSQFLPAAPA